MWSFVKVHQHHNGEGAALNITNTSASLGLWNFQGYCDGASPNSRHWICGLGFDHMNGNRLGIGHDDSRESQLSQSTQAETAILAKTISPLWHRPILANLPNAAGQNPAIELSQIPDKQAGILSLLSGQTTLFQRSNPPQEETKASAKPRAMVQLTRAFPNSVHIFGHRGNSSRVQWWSNCVDMCTVFSSMCRWNNNLHQAQSMPDRLIPCLSRGHDRQQLARRQLNIFASHSVPEKIDANTFSISINPRPCPC